MFHLSDKWETRQLRATGYEGVTSTVSEIKSIQVKKKKKDAYITTVKNLWRPRGWAFLGGARVHTSTREQSSSFEIPA